jgi:hypothetical protein
VQPTIYKLVDLANDPVEGFYYSAQLTKASVPTPDSYFFVEKILGHKFQNGVKKYLVKYLFYPGAISLV